MFLQRSPAHDLHLQAMGGPVRRSIRAAAPYWKYYIRLRGHANYGRVHNECHYAWVALLNIFRAAVRHGRNSSH